MLPAGLRAQMLLWEDFVIISWLCVFSLTVMDDKNVAKLNELIQQG